MRIAIITAGGAGMFCGSCMHDNSWAKALREAGADVLLLPTYTPIRTDGDDESSRRVFLGGINLYLDHKSSLWRKLPRVFTSWLDSPAVIRLATKFGVSNDAADLGEMTLAMLAGENGPQARGIEELGDFLEHDFQPDVVVFSNALLVGVLRRLRERLDAQFLCVLQGDDIFLDALPEGYRERATEAISVRAAEFDAFLTHSGYYADHMATRLSLPREKFHRIPLGLELDGHDGEPTPHDGETFNVGYFARICPEKGLQNLIPAMQLVRERHPHAHLIAGGYLEGRHKKWLAKLVKQASAAGIPFHIAGSPDTLAEKVALLKSFHLLSVPTDYHEPKGLPVLEALANGVPVVQPAHGAFPELVNATGGGLLVRPGDARELADAICRFIEDDNLRLEYAERGRSAVRERFTNQALAAETLSLFDRLTSDRANTVASTN